ncbi:hypothetical protein GW17_00016320 [Ensete ventricosum]|nr:hypothetical protein GW17_00016320 [Ensete ventricosum]
MAVRRRFTAPRCRTRGTERCADTIPSSQVEIYPSHHRVGQWRSKLLFSWSSTWNRFHLRCFGENLSLSPLPRLHPERTHTYISWHQIIVPEIWYVTGDTFFKKTT